MATDSELHRLAYRRAVCALLEAGYVLIDEPELQTMQSFRELEDRLRDVEVALASLVLKSGASWQDLADEYHVRKQSLHYRLRRRCARWLEENGSVEARASAQHAGNRAKQRRLEQQLSGSIANLRKFQASLEQGLPREARAPK